MTYKFNIYDLLAFILSVIKIFVTSHFPYEILAARKGRGGAGRGGAGRGGAGRGGAGRGGAGRGGAGRGGAGRGGAGRGEASKPTVRPDDFSFVQMSKWFALEKTLVILVKFSITIENVSDRCVCVFARNQKTECSR